MSVKMKETGKREDEGKKIVRREKLKTEADLAQHLRAIA
jgi:hypothetical protein